jgi:hypothetical protein
VERVAGGDAVGELAIDADVLGIENVLDVHHRRDGDAAFVDAAIDGDVRVAVDDAGRNIHAGRVDHLRIGRSGDVRPERGDFPAANQDRAVFDAAVRDGDERGVPDEDDAGRLGASWQRERRGEEEQASESESHRHLLNWRAPRPGVVRRTVWGGW